MTQDEVMDLLKTIKTNYQTFSINEEVILYWGNILKEYDRKDVINQLVNHINSSDYMEIPKPQRLVKNLITIQEKQNRTEYENVVVQCVFCKKWFKMKNFDNHYDLCLKKTYLINALHKKGKEVSRNQLDNITPKKIEEVYEKYIKNFCNSPQRVV